MATNNGRVYRREQIEEFFNSCKKEEIFEVNHLEKSIDDYYDSELETAKQCFYQWENDMLVTKEEWEIMAPRIEKSYDDNLSKVMDKKLWLMIMKVNTKLIGFDTDKLREDYITNYGKG